MVSDGSFSNVFIISSLLLLLFCFCFFSARGHGLRGEGKCSDCGRKEVIDVRCLYINIVTFLRVVVFDLFKFFLTQSNWDEEN